jgi:two-component system, OmpR family, sensor histidine kinase KdpD
MSDQRPDPDQLLQRLHAEADAERRARLKIFFGASAGVGKTYAMLVEAHERRRAGADVAIGLVETHGRVETEALLEGLETLPRRTLEHRGVTLAEFDLDAALARRPALLVLDELAHTNAPGSRHRRRWQDVLELLDAGIDVYTTLNVQHVETVVDVVAQITGVTVRETVPDSVLDRADEIELVDLPPDDLLQRLREGKVYMPAQAERATQHFFRKGNLIALRELALRVTAQRVDAQMESYRRAEGIGLPWAVRERLLVCVGDPDGGLRLVRAARRMAVALKAEWIVAHVETPAGLRAGQAVRDRLVDVLGFAEDLGAETAILSGLRVTDELLAFARQRNVSRIVVGRGRRPAWLERVTGSLGAALARSGGAFDVFIVRGEEGEAKVTVAPPVTRDVRGYLGAVLVTALSTGAAALMHREFDLSNLAMVYLLGVVVTAVVFGRGPAMLASFLSVAAFDFGFVPPMFTLAVSDTQYVFTFLVMLVVAVVVGTLTARLREQVTAARQREHRAAALYRLSQDLSIARTLDDGLAAALRHVSEVFDLAAVVLLPGAHERVEAVAGDLAVIGDPEHERGVAQWTFDHAQPAGAGTPTLPAARGLYLPLAGTDGVVGVLGVGPDAPRGVLAPDRFRLLRTFANQIASAIERDHLARRAEGARIDVETERMRNALLSSVSHDLRTPLTVITGAATSLRGDSGLPRAKQLELLDTIVEEGRRLGRLVGDLLDMTRLEAGAVRPNREWHSVEEVVGAALARLDDAVGPHSVELRLPPDPPLVPLDDVLVEQALFNLLENAVKYAPPGTPIALTVTLEPGWLRLEVADRGPGLAPEEAERVFTKFYRGAQAGGRRGAGLGLTICRAIAEAHGGRVSAAPRGGGGAVFTLELPVEGEPPRVEREPDEEDA